MTKMILPQPATPQNRTFNLDFVTDMETGGEGETCKRNSGNSFRIGCALVINNSSQWLIHPADELIRKSTAIGAVNANVSVKKFQYAFKCVDFNGELDGGAWFPWFKPLTNVGGYAEEGVDRSRDKRALRTTPTLELDCKKSPLSQILWPFTVQGENIVNPPTPPTRLF